MTAIDVVNVRYGHEAITALIALVDDIKRDDPLAPVTVIVPSNTVGVFTRRRLAGTRGVIAVSFLTVYRLGELLGAPSLAGRGRRPVSTPVVVAALGRALRRDPGSFAGVIDHPSTAEALFDRYRELSNVSSGALAAFTRGASPRVRDIARVVASARSHLAPSWYDEADLLDAATDALTSGHSFVETLGRVVVYLPQDVTVPAGRLLAAVAKRSTMTVVAGLTGDARADEGVIRSLDRIGAPVLPLDRRDLPRDVVTTASDPDAEVRAAVTYLLDAARRGTPFEAMALLYPADRPYRRLAADHLSAAGIAWNGPATTPLADRIAGRTLRLVLGLTDRRFQRAAVFELLAAVPARDAHGQPVPVTRWERISREAGVVAGLTEWKTRLERFARDQNEAADLNASDPDTEARARSARRQAEHARRLLAFIDRLARRVERANALTTWADLVSWARATLRETLGDESLWATWSAGERRAADRVDEILDRLGALDAVDPEANVTAFRRALQRELDDDLGRVGHFGEGVLVGPLGAALGIELELVAIVGAAEGLLPSGALDDSLIPDADREKAMGELDPSRVRLDRQHRHFLAAVAASRQPALLLAPRGDLRRPTQQPLSRWVQGSPTSSLASFASWVTSTDFPANEQSYRLKVLGSSSDALESLAARDTTVARGLALLKARRSAAFTDYDGNLFSALARPGLPSATSATRLETWVRCPFAYFVKYVLGVDAVEDPEEQMRITPLDRGSLVHETLDLFFTRVGHNLPDPDRTWDADARALLHTCFDERCADYETRGLTGRPLLWARDRRDIAADLNAFLLRDDELRAQFRTRQVRSELRFGMTEPFTIAVGDGRHLGFRGVIDRIDLTDSGAVVIDYKTGSDRKFKGLSAQNPLAGGTLLQLPIYALAARSALSIDGQIDSYYWFVARKRPTALVGYEVGNEAAAALTDVLASIVEGIEGGVFVAHPSEPKSFRLYNDCFACDPDSLGTSDAHRAWLAKKSAPQLAAYASIDSDDGDD